MIAYGWSMTIHYCILLWVAFCPLFLFQEDKLIKDHLINDEIRIREVRVVGSDGSQLGVMSGYDAKRKAEEAELDLVLISPSGNPPVCKIMDYGKFKFESSKREKEAKRNQKVVELKEVWLSATIDTNDMATKAKSALKFLEAGDKVRASIRLKGRQMARPEIAMKVMADFYEIVKEVANIEKPANLEGRSISLIVGPKVQK